MRANFSQTDEEREAKTGVGSETAGAGDLVAVHVTFPPHLLPPHAGRFEARYHASGLYAVHARTGFRIVAGKISRWKRCLVFFALLALTAYSQRLLNAKGTCIWRDPMEHADVLLDYAYVYTAWLNAWLTENWAWAEALQAASSLSLDVFVLILIALGSSRRSSLRPFFSLFNFFLFRFVAQLAAHIPCPPGYIWPSGALFGFPIPTLFVDYHHADDFFFSGPHPSRTVASSSTSVHRAPGDCRIEHPIALRTLAPSATCQDAPRCPSHIACVGHAGCAPLLCLRSRWHHHRAWVGVPRAGLPENRSSEPPCSCAADRCLGGCVQSAQRHRRDRWRVCRDHRVLN